MQPKILTATLLVAIGLLVVAIMSPSVQSQPRTLPQSQQIESSLTITDYLSPVDVSEIVRPHMPQPAAPQQVAVVAPARSGRMVCENGVCRFVPDTPSGPSNSKEIIIADEPTQLVATCDSGNCGASVASAGGACGAGPLRSAARRVLSRVVRPFGGRFRCR